MMAQGRQHFSDLATAHTHAVPTLVGCIIFVLVRVELSGFRLGGATFQLFVHSGIARDHPPAVVDVTALCQAAYSGALRPDERLAQRDRDGRLERRQRGATGVGGLWLAV
jgi:hypothetical protein